ncbi:MAG: aminoacetone oxidase family FAD-binding enzyme [Myxococcota bacterium]|nr:aminoacetone oxidase family FAD-binding enzyme [Myxococcota bacterium]
MEEDVERSSEEGEEASKGIIVVGGGAAGLMAALFAARGGAVVTLLEGSRACGLKILVSGGGRCNLLPGASEDADFFTSGSRNVLRRLFKTWRLDDVIRFFEDDLGIRLVLEEETGKWFPSSQSARAVRDRLVEAVEASGARVRVGHRVEEIRPRPGAGGFEVAGHRAGEPFRLECARLVLAAGGRSLPKTGSDGAGYALAASLGHGLVPTYPALVPLTSSDRELRELSGVAAPVRWQAVAGGKLREERERPLLITHRGVSGPAVLDASHWMVRDGAALRVAWGALDEEGWRRHLVSESRRRVDALVADRVPRRLAELLVARAGIPGRLRAEQLNPKQWRRLLAVLCASEIPVDGDEGYAKAEVTGGGIPLSEVNPSTLESRRTPGLYVCGELFDTIGRMGGFNFLWAWVTGRLAGESAAQAACET